MPDNDLGGNITVAQLILNRISEIGKQTTDLAKEMKKEFEKRDIKIEKLQSFMWKVGSFGLVFLVFWTIFGALIKDLLKTWITG